ncbi:MAG: anthranilate phosphoribosyltransferase [Chloroflexi bacterium]|nr:anthranilate phosphoribosyltransferase [Chloroflexota bacterium]MCY3589320.1 anthranilate phosphoribosyltransferase [Chloroflexota bacterium]MCY3686361.1 anthranilate phosphoribosyltransferase [Chloroflexota bacterium]MDE2708732.1 anthranilate phosphoribosyltransferase [Chloroflexota bacterium]
MADPDLGAALAAVVDERRSLSDVEASAAMDALMSGDADEIQASALLTGLRMKGESVDEVVGLARAMREHALPVHLSDLPRLADTAGTGGSGTHAFNSSTAAAFVMAGCGVPVAKHGNRAMSSSVGSADVLEALGGQISVNPEQAAALIREVGFGFLFAQAFHPAMRFVAPIRRRIGVRTVFNILGPLTNPARATHQLIGVARPELGPLMATALGRLGVRRGLVVHGQEGLDEVSPEGETTCWQVDGEELIEFTVSPGDFEIRPVPLSAVRGGQTAEESASMMRDVLGGKTSALTGFVTLNAAAGLLAAEEVPTFAEGVSRAAECIDDQRALRKLELFVERSRAIAGKTEA